MDQMLVIVTMIIIPATVREIFIFWGRGEASSGMVGLDGGGTAVHMVDSLRQSCSSPEQI
jgi:hypothetical protein